MMNSNEFSGISLIVDEFPSQELELVEAEEDRNILRPDAELSGCLSNELDAKEVLANFIKYPKVAPVDFRSKIGQGSFGTP
jgi:hypothetical protein